MQIALALLFARGSRASWRRTAPVGVKTDDLIVTLSRIDPAKGDYRTTTFPVCRYVIPVK